MLTFGIVIGFGVVVAVLASLLRQGPVAPADPAFLAAFSLDKYKPMERLFADRDYRFLESQPGYRPCIARKLRRERRRVFFSYLELLRSDFDRIHRAALDAVLASGADRPELSVTLVRQKTIFQLTVVAVRVRLALSVVGVGTVNVTPLMDALRNLTSVSRELQLQASS